VQDDFGHGTMTTGIMVADTNNGIGIAAVAPAARALIVKVLDSSGSGYGSDVAAGIEYAVSRAPG
jgi:subtilisin family serine protease